jgi:predicted AAA+ superfamily ATPase
MPMKNFKERSQVLRRVIEDTLNIDITNRTRQRHFVDARKIYTKILHKDGDKITQIANSLKMNHATIIHYLNDIDVLMMIEKDLKNDFEKIQYGYHNRLKNVYVTYLTRPELELEFIELQRENRLLKQQIADLSRELNKKL